MSASSGVQPREQRTQRRTAEADNSGCGLEAISKRELDHEGHEGHEGILGGNLLSFVLFVSFVVMKQLLSWFENANV